MKRISFLLIILACCSFSFRQNKDSLDNQTLLKLYKGLGWRMFAMAWTW